jgi:hypothetical protein
VGIAIVVLATHLLLQLAQAFHLLHPPALLESREEEHRRG